MRISYDYLIGIWSSYGAAMAPIVALKASQLGQNASNFFLQLRVVGLSARVKSSDVRGSRIISRD